jgi:hypothetical protein
MAMSSATFEMMDIDESSTELKRLEDLQETRGRPEDLLALAY